ncbi:hypothetical protein LZK98_08255 [Sphingomonas cannabina]|uniref:hypothetical protein n=1 Tax=Sphingomonas cannabina TaxID=2899123 RepID=UPI001F25AA91|nr:hypothetical protein [Sphingomonas cannabina]UIJ46921.1 hypothetical protein LZK98_08255 [Sphingomonas cannabina]
MTTALEDLQNLIGDLSADIAGKRRYGRVEQERIRRRLDGALRELRDDRRAAVVARMALADLCDAVEAGTANIAGLAKRTRAQVIADAIDPSHQPN